MKTPVTAPLVFKGSSTSTYERIPVPPPDVTVIRPSDDPLHEISLPKKLLVTVAVAVSTSG